MKLRSFVLFELEHIGIIIKLSLYLKVKNFVLSECLVYFFINFELLKCAQFCMSYIGGRPPGSGCKYKNWTRSSSKGTR